MRLPRKYKKECKKECIKFGINPLYAPLLRVITPKVWDLTLYVSDGCNSRKNCKTNLI